MSQEAVTGRRPRPKSVLIVEDVPHIAQMLKSRIEALDDFALVDESPATTYPEALAAFAGGQIDVVLLDINIPMWTATAPSHDDGVRLGELIADKFPATVIVVCTGNSHRDAITRCRPFSSVILEKQMIWQEDADVLEVALKAALSGQQLYWARDDDAHGHEEIIKYRFTGAGRGGDPSTSQEWAVIQLLHNELTNREIATNLHISLKTLQAHLGSIGAKVADIEGITVGADVHFRTAPDVARWYARTRFTPEMPPIPPVG